MQYFRIKNWETYQHYKDRAPPWIKLHREMLSSRTWVMLDDDKKALAIASMLLAAMNDNKVPCDPDYIMRVAYLKTRPDLQALVDTDFIEIIEEDGSPLADASKCLRVAPKCSPEERRGETEKKSPVGFDSFWSAWPTTPRKQGKSKCQAVWLRKNLEARSAEIISHVEAMKATDSWRGGYEPMPMTYLNQERWDGAESGGASEEIL